MKKIILIGILILTLGFWIIRIPQVNAECLDCTYTSTYDECGYDLDALHMGDIDKICIVGTVTEGNAWFSDKDPCINNAKTQACGEGKCPSFNYKNGATCQIVYADDLLCNEPKTATGVWDAGNSKCIQCGWWIGLDGIKRDNSEISVCGTTSGITYDPSTGKCNGLATLAFREICGASKKCEGKGIGCVGTSGFCDSNGIYNKCPGNDCLLGNCPDAVPEPPEPLIPTLPDTEFCKDVDYCADITVLNEGTKDADVQGCIKNGIHYCQDITIDNKECTKVAGTFSDYAPSEIPACPEKVESVDVECLGLPEDLSKDISTEYEKLTRGSAPIYPAYLSFLIQDVSAQPACEVDSVGWDRTDAWDGEKANINVKTSNCADGTPMNLFICEDDDPNYYITSPCGAGDTQDTLTQITINGNSAKYTWESKWIDDYNALLLAKNPPEYYAAVVGPTNDEHSDDMTVHTCMRVDWDRKQAYNDEDVNMIVKITDKCLNRKVKFDIQGWNSLTPNTAMESNYGETTLSKEIKVPWKAKWMSDWPDNPPEYIFYAKIPDFGSNYIENSSLMTVSKCIKKADWSEKTIDSGNTVSLSVETSDECKNKDVEIQICEDDGLEGGDCRSALSPDDPIITTNGVIDNNGKFSTTWTTILQEDSWGDGKSNEFYFIASVKDNGNVIDEKSSDILKVYNCIKKVYWSAGSAFEGDEVTLTVETSSACEGFNTEFEIWEDVWMWSDEKIITKTGPAISDGKSQVKWPVKRLQDNPNDILEYYFIVKIKDLSGNNVDEAESERLTINPCIKDALILCQHTTEKGLIWTETTTEYMLIDASRYFQLAKKEFPEIEQTKHWILDMDKYTIANGKSCIKNNISKYTIIDNEKYRDYIHKTYGNEEFYKKFKEMYGQDYADDLYCYKTVLKDTQWCQDMSRERYGLENNSVDVVDEKYLDDINKWNFYQGIDEMPDKDIFKDKEYSSSVIFEDAWTKVWTVTPLLNDTRNYLEWTKTGDSSAYAGWGFDRKSICSTSCDAGTGTNAASGCTEKSSDCDTCEGGECGDCTKGNSGSCPGGPGPDCYDTCKVDERSGYIVDADVTNAGVIYGIPGDCGGDGFTNYQCPSEYSCVDNSAHKCAKCPSSDYELLSLTMYDRQRYDSDDPATYSKVYKCIMDGVIKGETKFSIKDANVPDGVQPTVIPGISTSSNIKQIRHPAFTITETANLPYTLVSPVELTKTGDVYTLTEFYKPDSSYNKLRFEIDADTNFSYTVLPDAGKLQIEVNHTYTTSYIKNNYYVACSKNVCESTCSCDCGEDGSGCTGGYEYNYAYSSCGGASSWTTQSCSCDGGSTTTYRDERTTEILDDEVTVNEHWGFPWIWNFTTGGPVGTSPAVAYGKVFVSSNNKLYALDEFSGKKIWEFSISTSESSPTAAEDMVFVGSGNGILYAVDEKTGTQQWSWTVPGNIHINTKPAVDKGRVFFGSDDNKVYALDEYNGSKLWEFATGGMVKSSPTVADGVVFVGSGDGKIYALDEFSGEKKWEFLTTAMVDSSGTVWKDVRSSPTVSDGVVFVGSDGFYVYALNSSNGNYIWLSPAFAPVRTKPAVHDYRVFVGTMGLCSLPTWCSSIFAIDRYNGNLLWGYLTSKEILSSPAVAYNRVFVGSNDYNFYALDKDNGNLAWSYDAGGPIQSSPVIDKGMVFFGSVNGQVYALSAGIFPAHENPAEDARIKIEGSIDRYSAGTGFYGETVAGEINITLDPDILDSFVLSAKCAFLMYTSQIYPAEHKLIAKESSAGTLGKNYNYNESYGYENSEFGYLEQCRKTCPLACNCYKEDGSFDRLLPNCLNVSEEGGIVNESRTDCVCLPDWCYPEQCTSTRTFHEDEGSTIANGDFEQGQVGQVPYSWNKKSGIATQEFGGVSGYKLKLNGEVSQDIPSLSTNPANQICLDYWINSGNTGSFKLTAVVDGTSAVVDGTSKEFTVYKSTPTSTPTCSTVGWHKFCTPITGKISSIDLKSDIEVFVDNVNLGKYYDFVDLKTFSLEDVEIMDEKLSPKDSFGGISFDDVTHENNTYSLKFSTTQLPYTVFNDANITLITNFRNITVKLFPASADIRENPYVNVKLKKPTKIFVQKVDPGKYNLKPGTQVTIYLKAIDLETNEPLVNEKVIAIDEKTGEEEVLITDSNGETTFTTTVGDFIKTIIFIKVASAKASGAETKESLNPYKTRSPLLSVEFFVLIIIFLLAVFAYRWFRKGRMDFYEMWEEIRGKK